MSNFFQQKNNLGSIPSNIISLICTFLKLDDVLSLSICSKYLHLCTKQPFVWINLIKDIKPDHILMNNSANLVAYHENPKEYYIMLYKTVLRIRKILVALIQKHPSLNDKNAQIESIFINNFKSYHQKKFIDQIINDYYGTFPYEPYICYRILNGQPEFSKNFGLFGGFSFYQRRFEFFFSKIDKPDCQFLQQLGFHSFAICLDTKVSLMIDTKNVLNFGYGAIFSFISRMIGPQQKMIYQIFIVNHSFIDFLSNLTKGTYSKDKEMLDQIDTLNVPASDITTHGIRVRASSYFCPWEYPNKRLFIYQIRLSANNINGKYRLTTRHWKIIPEGMPTEEVKGPGVIGYYPEIYENCEDFVYESCTPIESFKGKMEGTFYFEDMQNKGKPEIGVQVGPFNLEMAKGSALIHFEPISKTVEILHKNI